MNTWTPEKLRDLACVLGDEWTQPEKLRQARKEASAALDEYATQLAHQSEGVSEEMVLAIRAEIDSMRYLARLAGEIDTRLRDTANGWADRIEAALTAVLPNRPAQEKAEPVAPNNVRAALSYGFSRGFIAACKWPAPTTQDVHSTAFSEECEKFVDANEYLYTAPPAERVRVPDGWKLVPIRPTPLMVGEGAWACRQADGDIAQCYEAMVKTAPAAPEANS